MAEGAAPVRGKLGALEIGRFIAAGIVVLDHVQTSLAPHLASNAHYGFTQIAFPGSIAVQFFFVLSGFVMMTAHRRDFGTSMAVPHFWWRRACRIYPLYWVALALPCYFFRDLITPGLAARLIALQPVYGGDYVAPAWSLRYEISFYILFGLCLLPYGGRILLAIWVGSVFWVSLPVAARHVLHLPPPHALVWLCFHGFSGFFTFFELYFFSGLLGGWLFSTQALGRFTGFALVLLGAGGICMLLPAMDWGYAFGRPIVPAFVGPCFAGVIVGLAVLERDELLRTGRIARWLGMMSYPLYILHADLILVFDRQFAGVSMSTRGWVLAVLAGLSVIYGVSALFTFLVDQPLQRYLRRGGFFRRAKSTAVPARPQV